MHEGLHSFSKRRQSYLDWLEEATTLKAPKQTIMV
jgi:hypothetical protein